MASIGLLSKDVITKNRIISALEGQNHQVTIISSPIFDASGFEVVLVDLDDSMAMLVLKSIAHKVIAFGSADDESKIKAARQTGCDRVYKNGEFYKKILPNFKV